MCGWACEDFWIRNSYLGREIPPCHPSARHRRLCRQYGVQSTSTQSDLFGENNPIIQSSKQKHDSSRAIEKSSRRPPVCTAASWIFSNIYLTLHTTLHQRPKTKDQISQPCSVRHYSRRLAPPSTDYRASTGAYASHLRVDRHCGTTPHF